MNIDHARSVQHDHEGHGPHSEYGLRLIKATAPITCAAIVPINILVEDSISGMVPASIIVFRGGKLISWTHSTPGAAKTPQKMSS